MIAKPPSSTPGSTLSLAGGDNRNQLLASIRSVSQSALRPVSDREPAAPSPAREPEGVAGALRMALMNRQQAMGDDDSDAGQDADDDDW